MCVEGVYRFLGRVWRMIADDRADDICLNKAVQDVDPSADLASTQYCEIVP